MFNLSQDGTITQYYDTFIALPNRMDGMSPKSLLTCFINGLKTEIHIDIIPLKPDSLPQAMQLARLYEDKYSDKCPMITRRSTKHNVFTLAVHFVIGHSKFNSNAISSSSKPWVNSQQIQGSTQQSLPGSSGNSQPFKRITFNEMQLRRAKGLCFNCDEKYSPTHKCPNKRLLLLQWGEDSISEDPVPTSDFTLEFDNSLSVEEPIIQQAVNTMPLQLH